MNDQPPKPYVGLQPFTEAEQEFFFGRDREVRVIMSNLLTANLTILYGPSGVGKSSILQAGVVPSLRDLKKTPAVYFNRWDTDSLVGPIDRALETAGFLQSEAPKEAKGRTSILCLILDQFEEYLFRARSDTEFDRFNGWLATLLNRHGSQVHVLVGLREDALSRLDQVFAVRIPHLLTNTLPLEYLDETAARSAIELPLHSYNSLRKFASEAYTIEPALVDEIMYTVRAQAGYPIRPSSSSTTSAGSGRFETALLQLLLSRLWEEEARQQSHALRLQTFREIGGSGEIFQRHLADVLSKLDCERHREIAFTVFQYLVTPSRNKIAQSPEDLIAYSSGAERDVRRVLSDLADRPDTRILRRLSNPERYELFHDVLAQPILDWRAARMRQSEVFEAERKTVEQARQKQLESRARTARILAVLSAALLVLCLAVIAAGSYAEVQRRRAYSAIEAANSARVAAQRHQAEAQEQAKLAQEAELLARKRLEEAERARAQLSAARKSEEGNREALASFQSGDIEKSLSILKQITEYYSDASNSSGEATTLLNIGSIYRRMGRYSGANEVYQRALNLARKAKDRRTEGIALNNIGNLASSRGNSQAALSAYQKALEIYRSVSDMKEAAVTLSNMGVVLADLKRGGEARAAFEEALAISRQLGDRRSEAIILTNLSQTLEDGKDFEQARAYAERALEIYGSINDRASQAELLTLLADIALKSGKRDEALKYFTRAGELQNRANEATPKKE